MAAIGLPFSIFKYDARARVCVFSRLHSAVKFYIDSSIVSSYFLCTHDLLRLFCIIFSVGYLRMNETFEIDKKMFR